MKQNNPIATLFILIVIVAVIIFLAKIAPLIVFLVKFIAGLR